MSRKHVWSTVLSALLIGMTGCVELKSYKMSSSVQLAQLADGAMPYVLPKTIFAAATTYVISKCEDGAPGKLPTLQVSEKTTIAPVTIPDPEERYYINSNDLKSLLKDSKISISTLPNQTLSKVSGTVSDLAGPTIAAALGTAINVAGAVQLGGIPSIRGQLAAKVVEGGRQAIRKTGCADYLTQQTIDAVKTLYRQQHELQSLQQHPPLRGADARISALTNEIAKTTEKLTLKAAATWEPKPASLSETIDASTLVRREWFLPQLSDEDFAEITQNAHLKMQVEFVPAAWSAPAEGPAKVTTATVNGLVLRQPALGTLRACKPPAASATTCPDPENGKVQKGNVLLAEVQNVPIPQLGTRMILPFTDRIFENNGINLTMGTDGSITDLGTQSAGQLNTFLTTLGTDAQAAASAITARNSAITARNTAIQAEVGYADLVNKSLADCLTQQKTIVSLGGLPLTACQ